MSNITYILFGIWAVLFLSCQSRPKKENDKQNFEYVHLIPDSLLNPVQVELKNKLKNVILEFVVIQDNKFALKANRKDFRKMGIPVEYYNLFKKNMNDNNKFIRDNKIENVSVMHNEMLEQLRETMREK